MPNQKKNRTTTTSTNAETTKTVHQTPVRRLRDQPLEAFAIWVREARRRSGLTQPGMARAIGCTAAAVGGWERGDNYVTARLHKRLNAFGRQFGMPGLPSRPDIPAPGWNAYFDPEAEKRFAELFGESAS